VALGFFEQREVTSANGILAKAGRARTSRGQTERVFDERARLRHFIPARSVAIWGGPGVHSRERVIQAFGYARICLKHGT
jgi:hypothetical protein